MYVNNYASSARILNHDEVNSWIDKHAYKIEVDSDGTRWIWFSGNVSRVYGIGAFVWLGFEKDSDSIWYTSPRSQGDPKEEAYNCAFGVRVLVTLKTDVLVSSAKGTGSVASPWTIYDK